MVTENTTPNRGYQEPAVGNTLEVDVGRLIAALRAIDVDVADAVAQIVSKAGLASPAFTGTPTAPTAAPGTDSGQLATTAFVRMAIAALVDSSPAALDTLNELAAALGGDPNFSETVLELIARKADGGFSTVAALLADTRRSYSSGDGLIQVAAGDIVQAQGFRYEVTAIGATDHDVETAGGVKLHAIPGGDGYYEYAQLGAVLDGVTDNAAIHQQAVDRGYPLAHTIDGVLYISTPAVTASTLWQFKGKSNGNGNWTINDNPSRVLCPNGFVKALDDKVRSTVISQGMAFVGGADGNSTSVIFDDGHRETTYNRDGGLEFHLSNNFFYYCGVGANAYNCWNSVARDNNFQIS